MLRFVILLLGVCGLSLAQPADPLRGLRKTHPRLIVLDSDLERVRSLLRTDGQARSIHRRLVDQARKIENEPPVKHQLVNGRILHLSRTSVERIYTLALLYRLDGKREHLDRAVKELRAAAGFPDWNANFLDKAEMTHAVAIGYDWLYNSLTPQDRALLRKAIVEKGLRDAIPIYEEKRWWAINQLNWNPVCNGGVGLGALAVAQDEPELARTIIRHVLQSFPLALSSYAPDGAWVEGPEYWHYATRYAVCLLAGFNSALGHDFGLSASRGFGATGRFRVYATGPTGKLFNYADGSEEAEGAAEMFWLARRFRQPVYAWHQRRQISGNGAFEALDLAWYEPRQVTPQEAKWPLDAYFRGAEIAMLQSSWNDPAAIFVGIKGGTNRGGRGHAHLDLGSFVLDAGGVRWAIDLGRNDYNVPDYFGKLRFTYYRTKTESHNTIQIDGADQDTFGRANIVKHRFRPDFAFARVDLSNAYPGRFKRFERGIALLRRKQVVVQDEFIAQRPVEALWGMVTDAEVNLEGPKAELRKGGWVLSAEILTPAGARFDTVSTQMPPPQTQNPNTRKLVVRLPGRVADLRLVVALTPYRAGLPKPGLDWKDRGLDRW